MQNKLPKDICNLIFGLVHKDKLRSVHKDLLSWSNPFDLCLDMDPRNRKFLLQHFKKRNTHDANNTANANNKTPTKMELVRRCSKILTTLGNARLINDSSYFFNKYV